VIYGLNLLFVEDILYLHVVLVDGLYINGMGVHGISIGTSISRHLLTIAPVHTVLQQEFPVTSLVKRWPSVVQ
jgi:hypothetical protein